jgi:hypothetical protein
LRRRARAPGSPPRLRPLIFPMPSNASLFFLPRCPDRHHPPPLSSSLLPNDIHPLPSSSCTGAQIGASRLGSEFALAKDPEWLSERLAILEGIKVHTRRMHAPPDCFGHGTPFFPPLPLISTVLASFLQARNAAAQAAVFPKPSISVTLPDGKPISATAPASTRPPSLPLTSPYLRHPLRRATPLPKRRCPSLLFPSRCPTARLFRALHPFPPPSLTPPLPPPQPPQARNAAAQAAQPKPSITVTLPDGKAISGTAWVTSPLDIATGISKGLAGSTCVASVRYSKRHAGEPNANAHQPRIASIFTPKSQRGGRDLPAWLVYVTRSGLLVSPLHMPDTSLSLAPILLLAPAQPSWMLTRSTMGRLILAWGPSYMPDTPSLPPCVRHPYPKPYAWPSVQLPNSSSPQEPAQPSWTKTRLTTRRLIPAWGDLYA